jgi:hypothetical protein
MHTTGGGLLVPEDEQACQQVAQQAGDPAQPPRVLAYQMRARVGVTRITCG